MRKGIFSLLIFFAGYIPAGAQGIVDSGSFYKVVDYLNCKLVDFSIERNKDEKAIENFRNNCKCDDKPNSATIQKAISDKLKKTQDLSKEINSIKSKFKPNWKVEDAIAYLKDTIFLNIDDLKKFNDNHQTEDPFIAIKNSIAEQFHTLIKNTSTAEVVNPVTPPTETIPVENTSTMLSQFTLPIIILIIVVFLLFVWLIFISKKLKSHEIPEHVEAFVMSRISKSNQQSNSNNSRKTVSSYDNSSATSNNKDIDEQLKEINERINRLQAEIAANPKVVTRPSNTTSMDNSPIQETFYLSTPNTDGSFDNNDISQSYREGASIYRFVKSSNNRATFFIEDKEDSVRRALQYPDKRIDPVCEAMNAFNQNAKSIKTITPGEVELIGDKWIISYNRKAKIRYE